MDLLSASRTNLFSATLVPYQTELIKFWEKSSNCLAAVYENIKDHKHYEFKLLKVKKNLFTNVISQMLARYKLKNINIYLNTIEFLSNFSNHS